MSQYESKTVRVNVASECIFDTLSNLENIEKWIRSVSEEETERVMQQAHLSDVQYDRDSVSAKVDGLGQRVNVKIIERDPNKTIKFGIEGVPVDGNVWIQMKEMEDKSSCMRIVLRAEIPMMFRMMLENKLKTGLDQAAEMLAKLPY